MDDILVHGETYGQLLERIKTVFARCEEWGITLSKEKYQFGPVVKFAGYIVSREGSKMNPDLFAAISKFPAPKDLTNLRSLIGLVNRFNDQNPDLKHAMVPWQLLLKKSNKFVWDEVHETALKKVKEIITNPAGPILRLFDPKLPIRLLTDASRSGIGFCLVQTEAEKKTPLLIMAGSRFSKPCREKLCCYRTGTISHPMGNRKMSPIPGRCRLYHRNGSPTPPRCPQLEKPGCHHQRQDPATYEQTSRIQLPSQVDHQ